MRVQFWNSITVVVVCVMTTAVNADVFDMTFANNNTYGYSDLGSDSMVDEATGSIIENPFCGVANTELVFGSSMSIGSTENDTAWDGYSLSAFGTSLATYSGEENNGYKTISKSKTVIKFTIENDALFSLDVQVSSTNQDGGNYSKGSLVDSSGLVVAGWNSLDRSVFDFDGMLKAGETYHLRALSRSRVKDSMEVGLEAFGEFNLSMSTTSLLIPLPSAMLFGLVGLGGIALGRRRSRTEAQ
ncbi:MAG: VPLPA-CTERM sorting domain-containing protein [Phycisphaerales bacterium]|nr:VPLPA-CTERM sorting domain-containing protein [Phycisphaerales bacterium]